MKSKIFYFLLLAAILLSANVFASKKEIIYVYDPAKIDATTGLNPDLTVVNALESDGYVVKLFKVSRLQDATQEQLDSLDAARLVIIGRGIGSGNFSSPSKEKWNAVKAPVISTNMWGLRPAQGNWFKDATAANIDSSFAFNLAANIIATDDPVFEGISSPLDWYNGPFSILKATDVGNGQMMASSSDGAYSLFVRFGANVPFYEGTTDTPAGPRTYIGNGSDNKKDANGNPIFNYYGYSADAKKIFMHEVARMVELGNNQKQKFTPPVIDGDGSDAVWATAVGFDINKHITKNDWTGTSDLTATAYVLWDAENLYVKVVVVDDILDSTYNSTDDKSKDHIRIDVDLDNSKPAGYRYGDSLQFYVEHVMTEAKLGYREGYNNPGNEWGGWVDSRFPYEGNAAGVHSGNTYTFELKIPAKESYGYTLTEGALVGIDFKVADSDAPGNNHDQFTWNQAEDKGWHHPDWLGTIILLADGTVEKVSTVPIIDGDGSDAVWATAVGFDINKHITKNDWTGTSDLTATAYVLWDAENLYVKVVVVDDILDSTYNSTDDKSKDHIRIDVDLDNSKPAGYRYGDSLQFYVEHVMAEADFGYREGYNDPGNEWGGWVAPRFLYEGNAAGVHSGNTYTFELKIPAKESYGYTLTEGALVGIDFKVADSDVPGNNHDQFTWNQADDKGWHHPDWLGTIKLLAGGSVEKVFVLPTIDGEDEYAWNAAFKMPINKHITKHDWKGASDLTADAYVLWDAENLYVKVKVTDDILDTTYNSTDDKSKDHIRIDVDLDNSKPEGYRYGDSLQFYLEHVMTEAGFGYREGYNNPDNEWGGWIAPRFPYDGNAVGVHSENTYTFELKIPAKESYGYTLAANAMVGIDFKVADSDVPGNIHDQFAWNQGDDLGWHYPNFLGTVKLMKGNYVNLMPVGSGDATLATLSVDAGTLSPAFQPDSLSYSISVDAELVSAVAIIATANDDAAIVDIKNAASLPGTATITVQAEDGKKLVYTIDIKADDVNSVFEQFASDEFTVYPNPAKEYVNVSMVDLFRVEIYNAVGKRIISSASDADHIIIPVTDLKNGIYIVKAINSKGNYRSRRLVVD